MFINSRLNLTSPSALVVHAAGDVNEFPLDAEATDLLRGTH